LKERPASAVSSSKVAFLQVDTLPSGPARRLSTWKIAARSLTELYATLSGVPAPKMRPLDRVLEAVEQASRQFTPVTLEVEGRLAGHGWEDPKAHRIVGARGAATVETRT
jgi:hypothetical protein